MKQTIIVTLLKGFNDKYIDDEKSIHRMEDENPQSAFISINTFDASGEDRSAQKLYSKHQVRDVAFIFGE